MKISSLILIPTLAISCVDKSLENNNVDVRSNEKIPPKKTNNCKASDILILKNTDVQDSFLYKMDSTIAIQYPMINEKQSADINSNLLNEFFNELNFGKLENKSKYKKKYSIKLTPENLKSKNESNQVELMYFPEDCNYRLSVLNYHETNEYSDEGSVIYSFKIINNQIKNFQRQEAG